MSLPTPGHLGHRALGEERVDHRLRLTRLDQLVEQLALAAAPLVEGQRGGGLPRRRWPRPARAGAGAPSSPASWAAATIAGSADAAGSLSVRSLVLGCGPPCRRATSAANATAPGTRSSTMRSRRPDCSASAALTGRPDTIIVSAVSTPTSRGRRCVPSAPGMMPRFTSGQAELRAGDRHAVVAGHGHFEPAAERGAVDRHHHRLRALLDALQQVVHLGRARCRRPTPRSRAP